MTKIRRLGITQLGIAAGWLVFSGFLASGLDKAVVFFVLVTAIMVLHASVGATLVLLSSGYCATQPDRENRTEEGHEPLAQLQASPAKRH
jgi:hypothetical protein